MQHKTIINFVVVLANPCQSMVKGKVRVKLIKLIGNRNNRRLLDNIGAKLQLLETFKTPPR